MKDVDRRRDLDEDRENGAPENDRKGRILKTCQGGTLVINALLS